LPLFFASVLVKKKFVWIKLNSRNRFDDEKKVLKS